MIKYLVIPETRKGRGTGHLVRSLALVAQIPDSALFLEPETLELLSPSYPQLKSVRVVTDYSELTAQSPRPVLVLDKPWLGTFEARALNRIGPIVAVDVRGGGLRKVPYVIDVLPRLKSSGPWARANRTEPGFFAKAKNVRTTEPNLGRGAKVLVAFGGEDAADLRSRLVRSRVIELGMPGVGVDILSGPRMAPMSESLPLTWKRLDAIPELREELHRYDLVITSFGLTALEAESAGVRVLLLNPTRYHEKIGKSIGLPSLGVKKPSLQKFRDFLERGPAPRPSALRGAGTTGMADFVRSLKNMEASRCPTCGRTDNAVVARFEDRTYFSCRHCGIYYMLLVGEQKITYNEAYFADEYEKQYGKTYLDDFDHIKNMGSSRISFAASKGLILRGQRLLDIGCAYGPFLAAGRDFGLDVQGCDISAAAVTWVRDTLGIPAISVDLHEARPETFGGALDIVSLWYVIEHFPDLAAILRLLNSLLKVGGILAMSTPSGEGISHFKDLRKFFERSPKDHYTVWRPSKVRRLLKAFGFRLEALRGTGHHPERFPEPLSRPALKGLSGLISKFFMLGETFEIYARKVRDPDDGPTLTAKSPVGNGK